jgi:anti-sigma regulatory factor (Ser/Thr protein kinase)
MRRRVVESADLRSPIGQRGWIILAISFGVWTFLAVARAFSMYLFDLRLGRHVAFGGELSIPLINNLIYACLTPAVYVLGSRYLMQRHNWGRRSMAYFAGGFGFTVLHVLARAFAYSIRDPATGKVVNDKICFCLLKNMFFYNVADDVLFVYLPILAIGHVLGYYQESRGREQRALQLEAQLTQAHLALLKSQLQPHFLFNAMHSISALMHIDVPAADRMMTRLSDLLRMSFENGMVQMTTLGRELEFVTGYLEIERVRFEDRLSVILKIAPDTLDAKVPHLLLQPLVENAVRHGVSRRSSGGEIQIAAWRETASLYLRVKDNGPGFDAGSAAQTKTGIGLRATRERLTTLYGCNQSIDIRTAPEGGVDVCVKIPFRTVSDSSACKMIFDDADPDPVGIV